MVRWLPPGWALLLAVVLLGRALGPGYVLSYDMVWVPDLSLGGDALGLGSALPRAIPSDAVVAALDEVLGGMVLQKGVLLGTLLAAGTGFAALVRERSLPARLVAVTLGIWNPYVVERLVLGHWPLLIGYAVLPWLVVALRDGSGRPLQARVPLLLLLGSLSASAGVITSLVTLSVTWPSSVRRRAVLLLLLLGANAPWVVAGLVSPATSTTDATGAVLFGTGDEGWMAGPVAALSFGGIWNAEAVPTSRLGIAGVATTVLLVAAALAGLVRVIRGEKVPDVAALGTCWVVGWGLATLSWASPETLGRLATHVPAGGLVRDGSRLLALCVPLVVVLVAVAVDGLVAWLPDRSTVGLVGGVLAVLPVTLMPDAAWGVGGRLDAVTYPAAYERARTAVADAPPGDAVSLPYVSYRAPAWNDGRRVLDPLGRYLDRPVVVNDVLIVSGRRLTGEDPRAAEVAKALDAGTPSARARALLEAGVSVVVVEDIAGYPVPAVQGRTALDGDLRVVTLGPAQDRPVPTGRIAVMCLAWTGWLAVLLGPLLVRLVRRRAARGRRQAAVTRQ